MKRRTPHGYRVERKLRRYKELHRVTWLLADDEARELLVSPCYFCGDHPRSPWYGSIERLDNVLPYGPGNAVACCGWCNTMKSTRCEQELLDHCNKIVTRLAGRLVKS